MENTWQQNSNACYTVFMYREELRRNRARLSTKLQLTKVLIFKNFRNMRQLNSQEALNLSRQMKFKDKLQNKVTIEEKLQSMGIIDEDLDEFIMTQRRLSLQEEFLTEKSNENDFRIHIELKQKVEKKPTLLQKLRKLFEMCREKKSPM